MPSRRLVLAGLGGLAAVGGVGAAARIRREPMAPGSPRPATWPLDRFDSANTGANASATTPTDPAVAWRREVLGLTVDAALVVGPDAVYPSDITYADSTTALERSDGTVRWQRRSIGGYLARFDGTLFLANEANRPAADLFALDTTDGSVGWQRELGPGGTDHLVAVDGSLLVAGGGDLRAYAATGRRQWAVDSPSRHPTGVAVGDGGLYATVRERIVRLRPRTWLATALDRSPPLSWQSDHIDDVRVPTVSADRLVVGSTVETGASNAAARPAVAAFDPWTGERRWGALSSDTIADPPGPSVLHARTPVVTGDIGVTALEYAGEFRADEARWTDDHPAVHGVVGLSMADGAVEWTRGFGRPVRTVAATGDAVLLGTGTPTGGSVVAIEPRTGREQWRIEFESGVDAVAPVDTAVFAVTVAGVAVKLR